MAPPPAHVKPSPTDAQPGKRPGVRPGSKHNPRFMLGAYLVGGLLTAVAVVLFGLTAADGLRGDDLAGEGIDNRLAQPALVLLFAMCALWIAETERRVGAVAQREQGGRAFLIHPTPLGFHILWALVAAAVWATLIPLPFALDSGTVDAEATFAEASEDFWILLAVYGFIAAGTAGVLAGSLVKKWGYAVLGTPERVQRQSLGTRRLWAAISARFRTETYFAFVGAGTAGMLPILFRGASENGGMDTIALLIVLLISVTCLAVALTISLNAWRSTIPMSYAESSE